MNQTIRRLKGIPPAIPAYATLLVAFFLRVYRLADQNIWWDEGWSIWLSQKDLAWIALRTAADEHPPLHYWMLHFWNMFAGTGAVAGRFLSVVFGVLTVALIYRIGKRMGGEWMGVLAALFLATARFHIWWSQDIKNYTPSIFFAFAAVWFALKILASRPNPRPLPHREGESSPPSPKGAGQGERSDARAYTPIVTVVREGAPRNDIDNDTDDADNLAKVLKPSQGWGTVLAYALCAALALWTHYLAALVLLALNVYALLLVAVRRRSPAVIGQWIVANAVAAALFAPWMFLYLQNAATWNAAPAFDFGVFLKLVATVLPLGVTTYIDQYAPITMALTAIAVLGCVPLGSKHKAEGSNRFLPAAYARELHVSLLPTCIILLPPLLIYVLSLTPVAFFAPKIQARYLVVLLPAYALLLASGVVWLRRFSVYLGLAAAIFVLVSSSVVLADYYGTRRLRDEYATLANTINAFGEPDDLVLLNTDQEWPTFLYYLRQPLEWLGAPNGARMSADQADALVQRARAQHQAIWLVAIPDALASDPQRLVEARLARDLAKQYEQTFGDKRLVLFAASRRDMDSVPAQNFAPQYAYDEMVGTFTRFLGYDLPVREARVGDTLRIVTYWSSAKPADFPLALRYLTTKMVQVPRGERVRVETDFVVPPSAVGDLHIDFSNRELARVRVAPREIAGGTETITHRADYRLGEDIQLAGYDLPISSLRAAERVPITLYWQTDRAMETSYTVFVHLLGASFNPAQGNFLWGQIDRIPCEAGCPTTAWLADETMRDAYLVPIDPLAPAGRYKIEVGLYDAATGVRLPVADGKDSIILDEIELR